MSNQKMKLGRWGEARAEKYLLEQGVTIIARNERTKYGELDLIGILQGQTVIFEVKTRSSDTFGFPEEAVSRQKQEHLRAAAEAYIQEHADLPGEWRIDVIAIRSKNGLDVEIEWFENAVS